MKNQIYDEKNGMSYTLHGDYYLPDLVLNEEEPIQGKYGRLRKQFLKEHRSARYQYLLLIGKLTEHLNQIDQEAREQVEMLMEQMVEKQGVTEELKVQDEMKWVRLMNNIKASAEEIVLKNTIYREVEKAVEKIAFSALCILEQYFKMNYGRIKQRQIVKERIEGGANEKAVWRLFINCPFVCINFDFFWLNKVRQLYMDF